jgi:hypothetical protein
LKFHLDGARIWNALVAKRQDPKEFGKIFDTISVCLSKGLGAPIGSVLLADSTQFIVPYESKLEVVCVRLVIWLQPELYA